jgi:hypothetical protein
MLVGKYSVVPLALLDCAGSLLERVPYFPFVEIVVVAPPSLSSLLPFLTF